ncbi:hypothetical protein PTI98_005570 [Pleurotus ostreatus]|nr:hypothetical protein PTI98_005570 [Pleurotus ostreatus]
MPKQAHDVRSREERTHRSRVDVEAELHAEDNTADQNKRGEEGENKDDGENYQGKGSPRGAKRSRLSENGDSNFEASVPYQKAVSTHN